MDLIDRQAAIDAVQEELNKQERSRLVNIWTTAEVRFTIVELILKQLPTAEPESTMGQVTDVVQSTNDCISRKSAIEALKPCAGVGNRALDKLRALPTVDAVEVVRCKDCKHRPAFRYDEDGDRYVEGPRYPETLKNGHTFMFEDGTCPCVNGLDSYFSYVPKDDWFCANGERRAEE